MSEQQNDDVEDSVDLAEPLDLDALRAKLAQQAEARGEKRFFDITLDGRTVRFPVLKRWSLYARDLAFKRDDLFGALEIVLDTETFSSIKELDDEAMKGLFDRLFAENGVTPGEASSSDEPSRSTRKK